MTGCALATSAIAPAAAAGRFRRNIPAPIPVVVLARLAIARCYHGQGLGRALFQDAGRRVSHAADRSGIRGLPVHAVSEDAKAVHLQRGPAPSSLDPMTLTATVAGAVFQRLPRQHRALAAHCAPAARPDRWPPAGGRATAAGAGAGWCAGRRGADPVARHPRMAGRDPPHTGTAAQGQRARPPGQPGALPASEQAAPANQPDAGLRQPADGHTPPRCWWRRAATGQRCTRGRLAACSPTCHSRAAVMPSPWRSSAGSTCSFGACWLHAG